MHSFLNDTATFIGHFVIGMFGLWVIVFLLACIFMLVASVSSPRKEKQSPREASDIYKVRKISDDEVFRRAQCEFCRKIMEYSKFIAGGKTHCPHCNKEIQLPPS